MFNPTTWKKDFKLRQPAFMLLQTCVMAGIVAFGGSCASSNRGYQEPPRLGAEYRFEDGLRKEKKPQYLFSKKDRKEMEKLGLPPGASNAAAGPASPSSGMSKTPAVKDSVRVDTVFKVRPQ